MGEVSDFLERIILQKRETNNNLKGESYIHHIYRLISHWLINKYLIYTSITPNQITIFRTCLFIIALFLFGTMELRLYILGLIFFQVSELLDSVDGDLARKKGLESKKGVWFEIFFDSILTPVWGGIGLLFAILTLKITGKWEFILIWGLIGFSNNLEKNFYIHFKGTKGLAGNKHNHIYFGFKKEKWIGKLRNFIIISKMWENQWLVWGGLLYLLIKINNIWWMIWLWLLFLNQIHWIRLAILGYKKSIEMDNDR